MGRQRRCSGRRRGGRWCGCRWRRGGSRRGEDRLRHHPEVWRCREEDRDHQGSPRGGSWARPGRSQGHSSKGLRRPSRKASPRKKPKRSRKRSKPPAGPSRSSKLLVRRRTALAFNEQAFANRRLGNQAAISRFWKEGNYVYLPQFPHYVALRMLQNGKHCFAGTRPRHPHLPAMLQRLHRSRLGFTLTELMIVIGILALLASIAVSNFLRGRKRSQATMILRRTCASLTSRSTSTPSRTTSRPAPSFSGRTSSNT